MSEFFAKSGANGPSKFTKMSKQFAQEQVMQQAIQDYASEMKQEEDWKMEMLREKEEAAREAAKEDKEEWDLSDDDEISNRIMEERMAQMRDQANEAQNWRVKGHGCVSEIAEEDFLKTVTKSHFSVVHFYSADMPHCKLLDKHLEAIAPKYMATKFVRIDATKAPFFVEKLDIIILPAIAMFEDGKMMGRMDGLEMLGGTTDFETELVECVLGASGCISYVPPEGPDSGFHSIFQRQRADIVGLNKATAASSSDDD